MVNWTWSFTNLRVSWNVRKKKKKKNTMPCVIRMVVVVDGSIKCYTHILTAGVVLMTSGFWPRVRARALRSPVFLGLLTCQTGSCAPPTTHRSFAAPPKIKK
jgi:hypothetical protein